jgi:hypothetical protein
MLVGSGAAARGAERDAQAHTVTEDRSMRNASQFFQDPDFNYPFLMMLGAAYYGAADIGAALAIANEITDGDAATAFRAFTSAGDRLRAIADRAKVGGHRTSAREAYLQASNYYFAATYFVDRMGAAERFVPTWKLHRAAWDEAVALFDGAVERVQIPYEGTTLPGYFFKSDGSPSPHPLLIMVNGSDGSILDMWTFGGAAAVARGYHCLAFDGPGQGSALWLQHLYFRPDFEKVITPVVDFVLRRTDVDPRRIALQGVSQGGYWVPRAVAFEHRIAAAVADPGVWDVSTSWTAHLPKEVLALLRSGQKAQFDGLMASATTTEKATLSFRMRPYGFSSPYDAFKAAEQYGLAAVVDRIRCPVLITDPQGEQFWPGQSRQLYDALRGPKTLVRFTAAEGGDLHCEPKATGLRAQRIFDWLDTALSTAAK